MIDEILTATITLFAVIDILGSLPIIIDLRKKVNHIHSEKIAIIALLLMVSFQYIGEGLLGIFGVDIQSFAIVGAIIIFLIALEMLLNVEIFKNHPDEKKANQAIVPIAFPLIAGAGSMTTIVSLKTDYSDLAITIAIFINLLLVYVVLKMTKKIERILGPGGVSILRKVFAIILLGIAVNMFKTNVI